MASIESFLETVQNQGMNGSNLDGNFTTRGLLCSNATKTTTSPMTGGDHYRSYRIVVDVYIVGLLCIVGIVGNALSIAVLYRDHDKRNTTNWLLQTLAVVDTLYILACFFFQTIKTIYEFTEWIPGLDGVYPYMAPYIWVFASIAQTITVWTVMLVTIDRYIAICKPLSMHLRSIERARIAVLIVSVLAVAYNVPRIFERRIKIENNSCGPPVVTSVKTELRQNKVYFLVYKTILFFMFRTIGPLLILIVLNVKLITTLRQVRRKAKDMSKGSKHRENITLMLVVVVSIFIICELPDLMMRIIVTMHEFGALQVEMIKLRYANAITNMLLTVNSSINFLIYCLVGKKFRKILMEMSACGAIHKSFMPEVSETEPLTTRTAITKNGTSAVLEEKGPGDVSL